MSFFREGVDVRDSFERRVTVAHLDRRRRGGWWESAVVSFVVVSETEPTVADATWCVGMDESNGIEWNRMDDW